MRMVRVRNVRVVVLLSAVALPATLALTAPSDCDSPLCKLAASGNLPGLRWPDFSDHRTEVQRFYEPTGYALAWTQNGTPTGQAVAVIRILTEADSKGLNAEDYDGSHWADRLARLRDAIHPPTESELAEFDLALTVAATLYLSDVHFGRVNPGLFHTGFDVENERADLPGFLRQRVIDSSDVKAAFTAIDPPYEGYRRTEQALQKYMALARETSETMLPVTKKTVDPQTPYAAVPQLSDLLHRLGDLPETATVPLNANIYEGPLVDAVKHFQTRHGLDPDGRLGKATFAMLNTPLSRRIRQLQLTLERWRWVPHHFPRPPIVVNIPEFELRALDESYATELEMKVVVGKAYRHRTPVFAADMKSVVFRPYWNVPVSIQRNELVPKLVQDLSYFAKNNYEVVTPQDAFVSDGTVDEATLAQLRTAKLRVRQKPGPENALGLVKFLFPNAYDVYMHDTPARVLFSKSRRDFSHGCIRVEMPRLLAAWVLREQPAWTPERIAAAMDGTKTVEVAIEKPIPVLVVYATAVVLQNGEVHFFQDIYGQDARLDKILAKGPPYPARIPTNAGLDPRPRE